MTARLLGVDPSTRILSTLQDALPGVPVGFDMPAGARKLFLTLSAGAYTTPVTQRWTLTVSAYSTTPAGILDHTDAQSMWLTAARALLDARRRHPLCDAEVQAGPMTTHDTTLGADYVYGSLLLTGVAQ